MFTFLLSIVVAAISDKPFYSLVHLKQDTQSAFEDEAHSIAMFKGTHSMTPSQYNDKDDDGGYIDVRDMQKLLKKDDRISSPNFVPNVPPG